MLSAIDEVRIRDKLVPHMCINATSKLIAINIFLCEYKKRLIIYIRTTSLVLVNDLIVVCGLYIIESKRLVNYSVLIYFNFNPPLNRKIMFIIIIEEREKI